MPHRFSRLLAAGFMMIIIMGVIVQVVSVRTVSSISNLTLDLYEHPFVVSNNVREAQLHITEMHRDMKDIILSQSPEALERAISSVDAHEAEVLNNFNIIEADFLGDITRINEIRQDFIDWKQVRDQVIRLFMDERNIAAALITQNAGLTYIFDLLARMDG